MPNVILFQQMLFRRRTIGDRSIKHSSQLFAVSPTCGFLRRDRSQDDLELIEQSIEPEPIVTASDSQRLMTLQRPRQRVVMNVEG